MAISKYVIIITIYVTCFISVQVFDLQNLDWAMKSNFKQYNDNVRFEF